MVSCPKCNSNKVAKLFYGMPAMDQQLRKDIEDKKIVLRGCFVSDDNPEFLCNECKYEWKKEKSGEKICKICEDVVIFCKCYEDVIEDILGE